MCVGTRVAALGTSEVCVHAVRSRFCLPSARERILQSGLSGSNLFSLYFKQGRGLDVNLSDANALQTSW
jgi:hypothetical protein